MERARDARLIIRRVMAEDEGVYTCRADNAVGAVEGPLGQFVSATNCRVRATP